MIKFVRGLALFRGFTFSQSKWTSEVLDTLKSVKLEDGTDIHSKGYVASVNVTEKGCRPCYFIIGFVTVELKLTQDYRKVSKLTQDVLTKLPWVTNTDVKMAKKETEQKPFKRGNFERINKIIAVSSCKGGVGKSTVAVNLAFSLHKLGNRIGIFDADVYGPSLPTLLGKEREELQSPADRPKEVLPIDFDGLKAMSYGFVGGGKKAVMRGPMVSSVVTQLAFSTQWGDLDYLIVYMPNL